VTAFQIRYDWTASFHQASGENMGSIVLQPIIPFKIGDFNNIARITTSYVVRAPSFSGDIDQNPVPPHFIPIDDANGLADTAVLDVVVFDASFGRWGVGPVLSIPTATDEGLGTGKWSLGPALVGISKVGSLQFGVLGTWMGSIAGDRDRDNVSVLSLQPFASYGLGDGWSVGLSELVYSYDFEQDRWAAAPFGGRIEKLVHFGDRPVRPFVDAEYNLLDRDISPEWTFRFAFVPLL
jgi:hypothetical protein